MGYRCKGDCEYEKPITGRMDSAAIPRCMICEKRFENIPRNTRFCPCCGCRLRTSSRRMLTKVAMGIRRY